MTRSQLDEIFELQGAFSLQVRNLKEGRDLASSEEDLTRLVDWSRTYILAAHTELSEMLDTVPSWKPHRRSLVDQPFNRDGFVEEGVDVFNYLLSALLLSGLSTEEFYEVWRGKLDVLNQRLYQEVLDPLKPGEPVVMLDIDGVLADWRTGLAEHMRTELHYPEAHTIEDVAAVYALDQDLGISPERYRDAKDHFHAAGGLRRLPRTGLARQLVDFSSRLGRIVVLSSRPGDDRKVYRDTLYWLKNLFGDTPFTLHFTRDKAVWLSKAGVELVAAVEDEPETAARLAGQFPPTGYPRVLVPAYGYNKRLVSLLDSETYQRGSLMTIASQLEALSFLNPED